MESNVKSSIVFAFILVILATVHGCKNQSLNDAGIPGYLLPEDLKDTLPADVLGNVITLNREMNEGKDPSFENVSPVFPKMKYPQAYIGVKEHMGKYLVTWDGMILCEPLHVSFKAGADTVPFGRVNEENVSRSLMDGYLPVITTSYKYGGIEYEETAFAYSEEQSTEKPQVAYIRMAVKNPSSEKKATKLALSFREIKSNARKDVPLNYKLALRGGKLVRPDGKTIFMAQQKGGILENNTLIYDLSLQPGEEKKMYFTFPHIPVAAADVQILEGAPFDKALIEVKAFWEDVIGRGMQINVPEEIINNASKTWLINNFILTEEDRSRQYYEVHDAAFVYEFVFGYAAAMSMNTLTTRGYFDEAKKYAGMFIKLTWPNGGFSGERLFVPHQNGAIIYTISQLYRVTDDAEWFKKVIPNVLGACNMIIEDRKKNMTLEDGLKPVTYGLLSPYRYCEDEVGKATIVQEYLGNSWCWAGLNQASIALGELASAMGELGSEYQKESIRLKKEADEYRTDIFSSMEKAMVKEDDLIFLPVAITDTVPFRSLQENRFSNYYNILSPRLLESEIFDTDDERIHFIPEFLEKRDGLILGLSRWTGFGGIDPHFIGGYAITNLRLNDIDKFLLTFYSLVSYGMARETFSTQECSFITSGTANYGNVGPQHWYSSRQPHLHSSSEMIRVLHMMLLKEEKDEVWLAWGTPRKWLEDGKKIEVTKVQTVYGPFNIYIDSHVSEGFIETKVVADLKMMPSVIRLKLRHPEGKEIGSVEINGEKWKDFKGEVVNIKPSGSDLSVIAHYKN
jgi:hypothetical protein